MADELPAPVVAAVLAGGRGTRIGGAKPTTLLAGRPLIAHVVEATVSAGLETVVVCKPDTALPPLDVAVVRERDRRHHPLSGVLAALERWPTVLAVPCDMPFLSGALLRWMSATDEICLVGAHAGRVQPFPALYREASTSALASALAREQALRATLAAIGASHFDPSAFGDPERLAFTVNTPRDLEQAERLQAQAQDSRALTRAAAARSSSSPTPLRPAM